MPFDTAAAPDIAVFAAYVCSDDGAAIARAVLAQGGSLDGNLHGGGLSGAARVSSDTPVATTVLAETGNIPLNMAIECVAEICRTGANVIVIGEDTNIKTYRAVIKAGALEYFAFPTTAEEILAVQAEPVNNVIELPIAPILGKSIAVLGCNGGVGASLPEAVEQL